MKPLNTFFTIQGIIFLFELTSVCGQRSIYDRDGQQFGAARYRRQKKSQRLPSQASYYGSPNALISPGEDTIPNSYYNRMPSNRNRAPDGINSKRISIDPTESGKIFHHHHHGSHHNHLHSHHKRRRRPHSFAQTSSPCYYRNAGRKNDQSQGRIFWDLNLLNIIPGAATAAQYSDDDCGGYGGSESFSPSYAGSGYIPRPQSPYRPLSTGSGIPGSIPGLSSNSIPAGTSTNNVNQNSDIYDPVYDPTPVVENQYAAAQQQLQQLQQLQQQQAQYATPQLQPQLNGGPNILPGQIIGGIAQTVNGVIQTLSGNTQQGQFLRALYQNNYNRRRLYRQ